MVTFKRLLLIGGATLAAGMIYATPAAAQATRTWVSGVGDDANPCSRTAPCKTFAGAISKTAAGGEINCLDPGGFGAVTITKSLTIDCHGVEGGVLAGGNGIVVNAGPNDVVVLRGLDFFGVSPPSNGVRFIAGGSLQIEDLTIQRFNAANSYGISFQPSTASHLYIRNVVVSTNGNGSTGGGILIQPTGTGSAQVNLDNVRLYGNAATGIRIDSTGNTGPGNTIVINNSHFAGSPQGITVSNPSGTTTTGIMINQSEISNNTSVGIVVNGSNATMRVSDTTITGNGTEFVALGGATISSFGNNRLAGNPTVGAPNNGAFTATIPPS